MIVYYSFERCYLGVNRVKDKWYLFVLFLHVHLQHIKLNTKIVISGPAWEKNKEKEKLNLEKENVMYNDSYNYMRDIKYK